jgi:hypothetical protein
MPKVTIEGVGVVNFPDDMTPDQITQAIETDILPAKVQPQVPQQVASPKVEPSAVDPVRASVPGRFTQGIADPGLGVMQLLSKIPGVDKSAALAGRQKSDLAFQGMEIPEELLPRSVDQAVRANEASYQEARKADGQEGFDGARLAGNIVGTAPAAKLARSGIASLKARMASGAGIGATTAAVQPVTEGDYWTEKGKQVAVGTAVGGAAPAVLGAAARVVKPNTSPEVTKLMQEGVTPTPGQIMGGAAQRIEEGATSIPIFGDFIKGAQRRAVENLNVAALNRVLAPLGLRLPKNAQVGHEAVAKVGETVSKAYDDLLPKLKVVADDVFTNEMNTVRQMATNLPEPQAKQFEAILSKDVIKRFTGSGLMTGEQMKEVESNLGRLIRSYGRSENPDHRLLSDALKEAQAALRRMVERGNPKYAGELKKVNEAYANLLRVENAAGRLGSKEGVFSPASLRGAVKATDSSLRKRQFSRGNAMMQDLAEAGEKVLGPKVPDSGTPFRVANILGGASGIIEPMLPIGAGIAGLGYSKPMQSLAAMLLTKRPDIAAPVSEGLRKLAPVVAAGSPLLYSQNR